MEAMHDMTLVLVALAGYATVINYRTTNPPLNFSQLTVDRVLHQLRYRYDREIEHAER